MAAATEAAAIPPFARSFSLQFVVRTTGTVIAMESRWQPRPEAWHVETNANRGFPCAEPAAGSRRASLRRWRADGNPATPRPAELTDPLAQRRVARSTRLLRGRRHVRLL